jgi:hypothetical protein
MGRMKLEDLPLWTECADKRESEEWDTIEKFIYENEPGTEAEAWRQGVVDFINQIEEATKKSIQGLIGEYEALKHKD